LNRDEMHAAKEKVLDALSELESKRPDDDAIRQRLQTIRKLMRSKAEFAINGVPIVAFKSTKYAFVVNWSDGALEHLEREQLGSTISSGGHADYQTDVGAVDPIQAELEVKSAYKVLLSHNWETDAVNAVLDDFHAALKQKLSKLPARWAGKFTVEVIYDRDGAMHGRAQFDQQIDEFCADADFAIFMTSAG